MLPRVIKRRTQRLHNNSEIHNQSNMTYPKLSKFILHSFLSSRKSLWRIQRVGHNWATESNCTDPLYLSLKFLVKAIFYGRKELRMNMIPRIHSGLSVNSKPSSLCELSKEQLQCCSIFLFGRTDSCCPTWSDMLSDEKPGKSPWSFSSNGLL